MILNVLTVEARNFKPLIFADMEKNQKKKERRFLWNKKKEKINEKVNVFYRSDAVH